MGLVDYFNKWIVEHGSAVVQEKQIVFFRDQLDAADKKFRSSTLRTQLLKTNLKKLTLSLQS
jgi:hypothetical protein